MYTNKLLSVRCLWSQSSHVRMHESVQGPYFPRLVRLLNKTNILVMGNLDMERQNILIDSLYKLTFIFQIECPDGPYEYHPIPNAYGSCKHYESRKEISKNELQVLYKDITSRYGNKLVIVASLELRWQALAPHKPITIMKELTTIQYCILELIGKGRENVSFYSIFFSTFYLIKFLFRPVIIIINVSDKFTNHIII